MKQTQRVLAVVLSLAASAAYGELTVHLPGENGFAFSGVEYDAPIADPEFVCDNTERAGIEFSRPHAKTFDLFTSNPSDILVIDFTLGVSAGTVYQDLCVRNPYGALIRFDTGPPPLGGTLGQNGGLRSDSWVTTPGGTACAQIHGACPGFENAGLISHFDSSNDGAQTDFHFARITLNPDDTGVFTAELSGVVYVANQPRPLAEPFSFSMQGAVPEPGSRGLLMTALLGSLTTIRKRRAAHERCLR